MASKKSNTKKSGKTTKKAKSHYPVVRSFPVQPQGTAPNTVVDNARSLSVINRRLMRFGRYYETKVDVDQDYAGPAIEVFVLRDDWAVQKAFQMAYQQYLNNTAAERKNMSSDQIARWEDFRVSHGLTLSINEARPMLATVAGVNTPLNAGEFTLSTVIDAADARRTFTWGTPAALEWGILQEYDKAGNAPTSPTDTIGSAGQRMPYSGIDTEIDDAMSLDLQTHGDNPPYDRTGVNASTPWVRVATLGGTGGVQKLSSGFFTAPCGLILLKGYGGDPQPDSVTVTTKAGDYKGVHAPSMLE